MDQGAARNINTEELNAPLTAAQFERIRQTLYKSCGIVLQTGKETMVRARLIPRLKATGHAGFDAYLNAVESNPQGDEFRQMVNVLTTNKTSFFREDAHFELITQLCSTAWKNQSKIRIWSAGCSSGEEPYTLAMVLSRALPNYRSRDVKILATDISTRVLEDARHARYTRQHETEIPAAWKDLFRQSVLPDPDPAYVRVRPELVSMVTFARLNFMTRWPMTGKFDAILCRNVMIYFDKTTQHELAARFAEYLVPGGHLFIGHSESLTQSGVGLQYVQPAVYKR